MQTHNFEQGSPAWYFARLGIPTASRFGDIVTTARAEPSKSSDAYLDELLAERLTGHAEPMAETYAMRRGRELEPIARDWYAEATGQVVTQVGFATDDNRRYGASPDGLIGDDGLLEIKCPLAKQHVTNLRAGDVDNKYWPQVQGQQWVTGREWCDWVSYHDQMQSLIVRVERDDVYIERLSRAVIEFCDKLDAEYARIAGKEWRL